MNKIANALLLSLVLIPASSHASEMSSKSLENERMKDMAADKWKDIPERRDEKGELKVNDSNIAQFNDTNFQHMVLESPDTFVIGFVASWCNPCQIVPPLLETLYNDMNHGITIATIDVDASPQTTESYEIRNIPAMLIFKDGKLIGKREYPYIADWRAWIDGVLKGSTVKQKVHFQKR